MTRRGNYTEGRAANHLGNAGQVRAYVSANKPPNIPRARFRGRRRSHQAPAERGDEVRLRHRPGEQIALADVAADACSLWLSCVVSMPSATVFSPKRLASSTIVSHSPALTLSVWQLVT